MSNSYVFPGGNATYVPSLSADLIVEFSRNPNKFPIAEYIDYRIVEKMRGYYVKMSNSGQNRVLNDTDWIWADGADSPHIINGNDTFTFPTYECIRRRIPKQIGQLSVEQAAWDILAQEARFSAMQLMTGRTRRIHETLTTSGNWSGNYATATTAGGGPWSSSSSTNNYIRKSIAYALVAIKKSTLGVVDQKDLFLVFNPNVAKTVATNSEFLTFIQQQPRAVEIWEGQEQFRNYGIPDYLMGIRCIVDDTVYNTADPTASDSEGFTLSDSYAVLLSKQKAVNNAGGSAFSTASVFLYEDLVVETFFDAENRRTNLYVTESADTSSNMLVAPLSGYCLKIDA